MEGPGIFYRGNTRTIRRCYVAPEAKAGGIDLIFLYVVDEELR